MFFFYSIILLLYGLFFWIFLHLFLNFSSSIFEFFFIYFWIFLHLFNINYYLIFTYNLYIIFDNFIKTFNFESFILNQFLILFSPTKFVAKNYTYNFWFPIFDLWFLWITYKKWTYMPLYIVENYGNVSSIKYDLSIYPQHFLKTLYPRFFKFISNVTGLLFSINFIESTVGYLNESFKYLYFDFNYFKPFLLKLNFNKIEILSVISKNFLFVSKNFFLICFKKFLPYFLFFLFSQFSIYARLLIFFQFFLWNWKKYNKGHSLGKIKYLSNPLFFWKYLILIIEDFLLKNLHPNRFFKKFDKKLRKFFKKFYYYRFYFKKHIIFFELMVKFYLWFFFYWLLEFLMPKTFFLLWSGFSWVNMNLFLKNFLLKVWFFFLNFF